MKGDVPDDVRRKQDCVWSEERRGKNWVCVVSSYGQITSNKQSSERDTRACTKASSCITRRIGVSFASPSCVLFGCNPIYIRSVVS